MKVRSREAIYLIHIWPCKHIKPSMYQRPGYIWRNFRNDCTFDRRYRNPSIHHRTQYRSMHILWLGLSVHIPLSPARSVRSSTRFALVFASFCTKYLLHECWGLSKLLRLYPRSSPSYRSITSFLKREMKKKRKTKVSRREREEKE